MKMISKINLLWTLIVSVAAIPTAQAHQTIDADTIEIDTIKITDGVYQLVSGRGSNITMSVGEDGVFIVDDNFTELTAKIKAAIATVTDKPVKFLINTHWHSDHVGGNQNFGKDSIIVAQHNVYERMSVDHFHTVFKTEIPAYPKVALPVITFSDEITLHFNGENITANHYPNAHTDGDSIIRFEEANVIHMGDIYYNGLYPLMDSYSKGSIEGVIRAVSKVLSEIDDETKVVPGHGPLASKADLQNYLELVIMIRDRMQKLIDEGKTLEEVLALQPYSDLDEKYGDAFYIEPKLYPAVIYNLLAK